MLAKQFICFYVQFLLLACSMFYVITVDTPMYKCRNLLLSSRFSFIDKNY